MKIRYLLKTAVVSLAVHKFRSFLTVLGILIGVASIILVSALGKGASNLIIQELSGLGAETLVVRPGKEPKGPSDFAQVLFSNSLKERELKALRKEGAVKGLVRADPEVIVTSSVSYGRETFRPFIVGFSAEAMAEILNLKLEKGRAFGEREEKLRSKVAVIGSRVKDELFGNREALGKKIKIKGQNFEVIGILAPRGRVVFFNVDELVLVPYTSAQSYLGATEHFQQIIIKLSSPELVEEAKKDIERVLRSLHQIKDPKDDDFHVETQKGIVEQVSNIISYFTAFLVVVVAISLLVGGIGVMNIMLVSVTERTREIGLRKALGAKRLDILKQFLLESVVLTTLGGILGIIFGLALAFLGSLVLSKVLLTNWAFVIPLRSILIGILVSSLTGIVFGLYPARQASLKSPIEALRYE